MPQEVTASVKNTRGYFRSSSQPHRHGRRSSLTAHRHASGPTSVPASATALPSCTPRPLKGPSPCPAASSPNDFSFAEAEHKENQKRFGSEPLRTWLPAVPQRLGFCEPAGVSSQQDVLPWGPPHMHRDDTFHSLLPREPTCIRRVSSSDRPAPAALRASAAFQSAGPVRLPASVRLCLEGSRNCTDTRASPADATQWKLLLGGSRSTSRRMKFVSGLAGSAG